MELVQRLQCWWRNEQLITATLAALTARTGVHEQSWPSGTAVASVLAWYDQQLAASRTPHGLSAARIVAVNGSLILLDISVDQRHHWYTVRDQVGEQLAPLLATHMVTTGVINLGTAVHTALTRTKGDST